MAQVSICKAVFVMVIAIVLVSVTAQDSAPAPSPALDAGAGVPYWSECAIFGLQICISSANGRSVAAMAISLARSDSVYKPQKVDWYFD
ncbi:hypothetical protein TB2_028448 [Malus domestica]